MEGTDEAMSKLMLSMVLGWTAFGSALPFFDASQEPTLRRFEYSQVHMGGAVRITLYAESESKAEAGAKAAFGRFAELEQVLSDYRPSSEISQLCRSAIYGPVKISNDLYRVLRHALDMAKASDGAFDPTIGPLVGLWRDARRTGKLPDPSAIAAARERVGWQYVDLDDRTRTVFLRKHNLKVDFGGIAKGDACDQAIAELERLGIRSALVEAGGDIVMSAAPPDAIGWKIELTGKGPFLLERISLPAGEMSIYLKNMAISTSGDAEQFVEFDGKRYSHIVDPKTGFGLTSRIQATVIARRGLTTDPLATTMCVLGPEQGRKVLSRYHARGIFMRGS